MSTMLDKARREFEAGKYKAAVSTLWDVEREVRGGDDIEGAQGLLDVASALREQAAGKFRGDCDALCGYARKALDQATERESGADLRAGALAVLPGCRLIGGSGFDIERPSEGTWDVIFKDEQVLLHQEVRSVSGGDYRGWGRRWRSAGVVWPSTSVVPARCARAAGSSVEASASQARLQGCSRLRR